ncbi:MAG: hypothetical protein JJW01_03525 [Alphaproteobacteria bacterium]|nr:hypothetical protein [Rickettsiales bacterium]
MKRFFIIVSVCSLNYTNITLTHANVWQSTNKQLFSSRSLYNLADNFIIYGDQVIVQHKAAMRTQAEIVAERERIKKEYQLACEKADDEGIARPEPSEFIKQRVSKLKGYEYIKPKKGCYFLENEFRFCCSNGRITKVLGKPNLKSQVKDFFFHSATKECKLLSYHVMYNFLFKKRFTLFHQYQLRMSYDLYPSFLRVMIVSEKDLLSQEDDPRIKQTNILNDTDLPIDNLLVFYLSDINEVGCLPFNAVSLSSNIAKSTYRFNVENYVLTEEWKIDFQSEGEIFIDSHNGIVTKYRRHRLNNDMLSDVVNKGGMMLKDGLSEVTILAEELAQNRDKKTSQ